MRSRGGGCGGRWPATDTRSRLDHPGQEMTMTDESLVGHPAAPRPGNAVAVLGTGIMGSAMTRNLVAAGVRTTSTEHGVPPLHAMTLSRSQRKNEEAV